MKNARLSVVLKHHPTLDSGITSEYLSWCNINDIDVYRELNSTKNWLRLGGIDYATKTSEELISYSEQKELRRKSLILSGRRTDTIDITLVKIFLDDGVADIVYKEFCMRKTKSMIDVADANPLCRKAITLEYLRTKHDEETAQKIRKDMCYKRGYVKRVEYYTDKGMPIEDAKKSVSKSQSTFSKEKCIEKHGEVDGHIRWKQRQDIWQETINSKSQEEISEINKKKAITLDGMQRKYGVVEGLRRYNSWAQSTTSGCVSKESIQFFESFIPKEILQDSIYDTKEHTLFDLHGCRYKYDFRYKNIMIEYHGHGFHPNPRNVAGFLKWKHAFDETITRDSAMDKDTFKRHLAFYSGFKLFEIYSNDSVEFIESWKSDVVFALLEAKNLP